MHLDLPTPVQGIKLVIQRLKTKTKVTIEIHQKLRFSLKTFWYKYIKVYTQSSSKYVSAFNYTCILKLARVQIIS